MHASRGVVSYEGVRIRIKYKGDVPRANRLRTNGGWLPVCPLREAIFYGRLQLGACSLSAVSAINRCHSWCPLKRGCLLVGGSVMGSSTV